MKLMNRILGVNDNFEVFRRFPGYSELHSDLDRSIALYFISKV